MTVPTALRRAALAAALSLAALGSAHAAPSPLLDASHPVSWWFAFKFNAASFPGCGGAAQVNSCQFGGNPQSYTSGSSYSQQYVYASSSQPSLSQGGGCIGDTPADPVGATFNQIYNGTLNYVVWNDQFYDDPSIPSCSGNACNAPWGHSKGVLAWDAQGNGVVMQVSTPSWPASGSAQYPRSSDGNTLGCVQDNDVEVSQHFFSLKLSHADVLAVLQGLANASAVTDPGNPQIVKNGGPADIQAAVSQLGQQSSSTTPQVSQLSSGVTLIAKPSALQVAPWQLVSAELGGISLRAATWWEASKSYAIPTTTKAGAPACWDSSLPAPGPVAIATSGSWAGQTFSLKGGLGKNFNHAKIGVSTSGGTAYAIFGDMNQEGALSGNCASAQNGRGGLFFALPNAALAQSIGKLIGGSTAAAAR
ncbi:deoxyribonuclease II family protein [Chromobacterium subtsugae]|uniref:deoxyribonuclease II family protein n=1 Tax=Chromobacterium subtsugae TaxID=251747 RepID=UPI000640CD53|nr:deoxyribonuclease II family protein [Chromobacterium subtsugae]